MGTKFICHSFPRLNQCPEHPNCGPTRLKAGSLFRWCLPRSDVRSRPAVPSHGTLMAISKHSLAGGCEESTGKVATAPSSRNAPNSRGTKLLPLAWHSKADAATFKASRPNHNKSGDGWAFQSASRHGSQDFTFGTGPGCRARGQRWFAFCPASTLRQHDVCRWSGPHWFGQDQSRVGELAGSAGWSAAPRAKRSSNLSLTGDRGSPSARQSQAVGTPGRDSGLAVGVAVDEPFLRLKTTVVSAAPWLGLGSVTKSTSCHNSLNICSKFVAF